MRNSLFKVALTALFVATPFIASANMIWPSLYIVEQYYAWYIILAALAIEIVAARIFLKTGWWRSTVVMFVANAISALVGVILIPLSGIFVELLTCPFGVGTFHLSHWILDYICVVFVNTAIEGWALKGIFKYPFKRNFWWLFGANLVSVLLCVAIALLTMPE